jgi:integrase
VPTKRLSKQFIEGIKPPARGRVEYFDSASPGLVLRVTSSGHKSWSVVYRFGGKLRRYTIGPYVEGKARKEFDVVAAREKRDEVRALLKKDVDPAAQKKASRNGSEEEAGTFATIARDWLDRHVRKNCAPSTYKETERLIERDVIPKWRDRTLESIKFSDVDSLVGKIAARGAEVHANRVLQRLRALFNWAVSRRLLPVSPIAGMKPPTKERSRDRWLSDEEVIWFWQACDQMGAPFGPLFKLLLLTAQRRDEVGTMEWAELDLDRRLWTLPRHKAKNDRVHEVQLSDAAIDVLKGVDHVGNRFVFTTDGKKPASGFSGAKLRLDAAMVRARRRSLGLPEKDDTYRKLATLPLDKPLVEISQWILHDLRRTAASGMARLKVGPHVVDKILNHTSGAIRGVAAVYNRFDYADERRSALQAWGGYVQNLISPGPANVVTLAAARG